MTSAPSFAELLLPILGAGMFVVWVVSDVLEEQLLGRVRRERQRVVRERARRVHVRPDAPVVTLPRAQVRRLS